MPGAKSAIAEGHRRLPPAALELRGERWFSDADEKVCIEIVQHAQGQAEKAHGLCVCLAATNEKVHEAALCDPNYRCVGAAALLWETAERYDSRWRGSRGRSSSTIGMIGVFGALPSAEPNCGCWQ
jgi:hypothetical protein